MCTTARHLISCLRRDVEDICALLEGYAGFSGICKTSWPLKMGPICCHETSVQNYQSTLCNIPQKGRSQPTTCSSLTQDQSRPHPPTLFLMMYLNIILPPKPGPSKWSLTLVFPTYTSYAFLSLLACHIFHPSHFLWFDHANNIWRGIKIIKIFFTQFSPVSCYFFPLTPQCLPYNPVLEILSLSSCLYLRDQVSHT
jgi:hypothetical protein